MENWRHGFGDMGMETRAWRHGHGDKEFKKIKREMENTSPGDFPSSFTV